MFDVKSWKLLKLEAGSYFGSDLMWLSLGLSTTPQLNSSFAKCIRESLVWNFFLHYLFEPSVLRIRFHVFFCSSISRAWLLLCISGSRESCNLAGATYWISCLVSLRRHPFSLTAASSFPFSLLLTQGKVLYPFWVLHLTKFLILCHTDKSPKILFAI